MRTSLPDARAQFDPDRVEAAIAAAHTGDGALVSEVRAMTRVGVDLIELVQMLRQQRGALDAEIGRLRTENLSAVHAGHACRP